MLFLRLGRASSSTSITTQSACLAAPYIAVRKHPLPKQPDPFLVADAATVIFSAAFHFPPSEVANGLKAFFF